jgi:hypothetical protein
VRDGAVSHKQITNFGSPLSLTFLRADAPSLAKIDAAEMEEARARKWLVLPYSGLTTLLTLLSETTLFTPPSLTASSSGGCGAGLKGETQISNSSHAEQY